MVVTILIVAGIIGVSFISLVTYAMYLTDDPNEYSKGHVRRHSRKARCPPMKKSYMWSRLYECDFGNRFSKTSATDSRS
jgi:hypothetical protein